MQVAVSNAASALGQEIGHTVESALVDALRPLVENYGHSIGPERLKNGTGNIYQIDAVIRDEQENPLILLDPKYIRYKKHNRDKGSWLCTAHYNLRKTYPSIRKTLAVLAGNWSNPSIALIQSFGIEVIMLPFDHMVSVLARYGVTYAWGEKDRETPKRALAAFQSLSDSERRSLAGDLIEPVIGKLRKAVEEVIGSDLESTRRRVSSVEVVVKTDRNEMLLLQYETVADAVAEMTINFMADRKDVKRLFK